MEAWSKIWLHDDPEHWFRTTTTIQTTTIQTTTEPWNFQTHFDSLHSQFATRVGEVLIFFFFSIYRHKSERHEIVIYLDTASCSAFLGVFLIARLSQSSIYSGFK